MNILKYQVGDFPMLRSLWHGLEPDHPLRCREFVDYYYGTTDICRLYYLLNDSDNVLGVFGVERMNFSVQGCQISMGFGSNFVSFYPGAGAMLFLHWIRNYEFGVVFGGSEDTHRILRRQRWKYVVGVKEFILNRKYLPRSDEGVLRRTAKAVARQLDRRIVISRESGWLDTVEDLRLSVVEERRLFKDCLPRSSAFSLRFAPDLTHLNWRYSTELPFVRYRVFRVLQNDDTIGYVILNHKPEQIIVAHCDGEDPLLLAYGVCAAAALAVQGVDESPTVLLTSSHPVMQGVFKSLGFRSSMTDRPLAFGGLGRTPQLPGDPSSWLVNFDWGDNGLRPPFLRQPDSAVLEGEP